jgi:hypothetical protein
MPAAHEDDRQPALKKNCSSLLHFDALNYKCWPGLRGLAYASLFASSIVVTPRKQLSMVLPLELIEAIKQRAAEQGLSITAYVANLVRRDLGHPALPDPLEMAEQLHQLQERVDRLERGGGEAVDLL